MVKKVLFMMLVLASSLSFYSCSDDEEETVSGLTEELLTGGTWYVSEIEMDGVWEDMSSLGIRVVFDTDGEYRLGYGLSWDTQYYKGTWQLNGNTVSGVTVDGIKEYFKFKDLNGTKATIEYTNNDEITTPLKCKAERK